MTANHTATTATRSRKMAVAIVSFAFVLVALIAGSIAGLAVNQGSPANATTSPAHFTPITGKATIGDTGGISIEGSASLGDTGTTAR